LPEASRRASFLYHRARIALRGYSFVPKAEADVPVRVLRRIDACYALSMGLGFVDTMRALEYQARGLLLALSAGETLRVARGLTFEVGFVATEGYSARPKWKRILEQTHAVLKTLDDPYASALIIASEGVAELLSGDWKRSLELCDHASKVLHGERHATAWELDTAATYSLRALLMMGELKTLGERAREHMRDADARGDQFLSTNIRIGGVGLFWLAEDDPSSAQDALDEAMQKWSGHGHSQHMQELIGRVQIDLYAGEGKTANLRVERAWVDIEEARFLRIELWRIALRALRARTAIAWARDDATRRRTLLEQASREANDVARTGAPWGLAEAALLRGAIAEVAGDKDRALVSYEHAREALEAVGMKLHANVARMRAGALMSGDAGAEASRAALEWMHGQGIVRPDRIASLLAPSR
jgi:eukaryotic-like serine/threonine-protein kinase